MKSRLKIHVRLGCIAYALNAYRMKSQVGGLFLAGSGVVGPGVAPRLALGMEAARAAAKAGLSKQSGSTPEAWSAAAQAAW